MSETRVPEQAIRDQLDKILASEVFSRSERLAAFLRFVVIETIEGRGHTLKEQVIAASQYQQRAESYIEDGAAVRADARRLRDKLREYYSEFPAEPVVISLQKGSYKPGFTRNRAPQVAASRAGQEAPATPPPATARLVIMCAIAIMATLTAVAVFRFVTNSTSPPPRVIPLTLDAGGEGMPSLSPDGNFVAYQHWAPPGPSAQDIWIKAVNSDSRRRLTDTPPPIAEHSPAWSPDGTEIVFERVGFGKPYIPEQGIFVISVLGGPERKISGSGRDPKWTPDGRSMLIRDGSPSAIFQIDLSTLARRQVTTPPAGDAQQRFDVSPDGTTLAFIQSRRSGAADIYVVPMTGGEPRQLTSWGAPMNGLTWTPDGRDLIYDVSGQSLWRIPANTRVPEKGKPVPGLESLVTSAATAVNPSMSRPVKGPARLAFQIQRIDVSLRIADLSTPPEGNVLRFKPILDADRVDMPGAFSPDGERFLFYSYLAGAPVQLRIAKRDGSGVRQIQPMQVARLKPGSWSPDGGRFAFEAARDGTSEIYTASHNGGEIAPVTHSGATSVTPRWSPDGKWLYYSSNRSGRYEIWRSSPQGEPAQQVTRSGGIEPELSFDGRYLFFMDPLAPPESSAIAWTANLKMVPVDGNQEPVVVARVRRGLWGAVDQGILHLITESDFEAINLLRLPERSDTRVGRLPFLVPKEFPAMTFSRDGRWILTYQVDRRESDLMLMDNFR